MEFEDLNDYCLLEVLNQLSSNDLCSLLLVNPRLKRLAAEKMRDKVKVIIFEENYFKPSICSHLGTIRPDQVLDLKLILKQLSIYHTDPEERISYRKLLDVFAICSGVKSIDFGTYSLPDGFLLEVVQLCPEIECFKSQLGYIEKLELNQVMDQIGHRLVHILKIGYTRVKIQVSLLTMIAEKCPNIKQVDWYMREDEDLTSDSVAAFKLLPKSCCKAIKCDYLNVFEDIFDELEAEIFNWSLFGHRLDRLSSLKNRNRLRGLVRGVNFINLKKLEYTPMKFCYNQAEIKMLCFSRFPRLEEFCFNPGRRLTEDNYQKLFQKMRSVKKLTIVCEWSSIPYRHTPENLPGSSIHQLKKLDTIDVKIRYFPKKWQPDNFLKKLEEFVDNIGSLKKLSVKSYNTIGLCRKYEWQKTVEDKIKQMKMKQKCVEVDFIIKNDY